MRHSAVSSKLVNSPVVRRAEHRIVRVANSNVVLAIDIETGGDGINFPDKGEHPVFQIGCIVGQVGCDQPSSQTVFTWKPTAAITGVDLVVIEDEVAMLNCFSSFVIRIDPDVITGFNLCRFDLKYLIERLQKLRPNSALCIGRMEGSPMRFFHKPNGRDVEVIIPGRIVHDVFLWIQKQHHLVKTYLNPHPYTLEACARHFLKDSKESVKWQQIVPMFNGTDAERGELAVYCLKDAHLALRLMNLLSKNCPEVKRFFELASTPARTIAAVPAVSVASTVATGPPMLPATNGSPISPTSSLPPAGFERKDAILARLEANKPAAWQWQKAAEDTSNLQKKNESVTRATAGALATLPLDSCRSPAANVLQPSLVQSDGNQVKRSIKKNRGALDAMFVSLFNPILRKIYRSPFKRRWLMKIYCQAETFCTSLKCVNV